MGFPILVRWHLYIKSGPCCLVSCAALEPGFPDFFQQIHFAHMPEPSAKWFSEVGQWHSLVWEMPSVVLSPQQGDYKVHVILCNDKSKARVAYETVHEYTRPTCRVIFDYNSKLSVTATHLSISFSSNPRTTQNPTWPTWLLRELSQRGKLPEWKQSQWTHKMWRWVYHGCFINISNDILHSVTEYWIKILRGQKPISVRTYFRHICSLGVNFIQLWFFVSNRFLIKTLIPPQMFWWIHMYAKLKVVVVS